MSAPLVVSIPHRLGREEAARRLKGGLSRAATSVPVLTVDEERWDGDQMFFRVRAMGQAASGQIDVADDHVRLEVMLPWLLQRFAQMAQAVIRDRGTAAADEAQLTRRTQRKFMKKRSAENFVSLLVTNSADHVGLRGRGNRSPNRHDIRQAVRPSIPGGLRAFRIALR